MRNPKFQIFKGADDFRFRLRAANGEIILAGEAYTSKQSCNKAINSIIKHASNVENFQHLESKDDKFYFNLRAGNHKVIATSEMYNSTHGRQKTIDRILEITSAAGIEDLTLKP